MSNILGPVLRRYINNMAKHPELHPLLENFNIFESFKKLVDSEEDAVSFLTEISLLPSRQATPPHCCGLPMLVENSQLSKIGWRWRCSTKSSKKKGAKACRKTANPCAGTFFDGNNCKIAIRDVLAIIITFVIHMKVTDVHENLVARNRNNGEPECSRPTIIDYFSYCREIAEVISSHSDVTLGGPGKTVQIDETFLTKRKYHRGRITEQMTVIVLGLYCKEDRTGRFFKVNSKRKRDLWPYIQRYVHPNTSKLCTDSAKQYYGIENMFSPNTVHLTTNHSIGEFVSETDKTNTINDLENQNKLFKKSISSRRTDKLLLQYMAEFWYRQNILQKFDKGSRIMQFLLDIKQVYPGYVNGVLQEGVTLKSIDEPILLPEVEALLPPEKRSRLETDVEDDLSDIEEEIALNLCDGEHLPEDYY